MDYYRLLGVSYDATDDEIRTAYRKLSKECHPDNTVSDSEIIRNKKTELFRKSHEAYKVLSDPEKKKEYDLKNGIIYKREQERKQRQQREKKANKESTKKEDLQEKNTNVTNRISVGYDFILNYMNNNYMREIDDDKTIKYTDSGKIVGVKTNDDVITLYFYCPESDIWNHNERVMIGIAKSFPVISGNSGVRTDILLMKGMTGAYNYFKKKGLFIKYSSNFDIDNYDLGFVGHFSENHFSMGNISFNLGSLNSYAEPDNMIFNVLPKEQIPYTVDSRELSIQLENLKRENSWRYGDGYDSRNSKQEREKIDFLLEKRQNYHLKYNGNIYVDLDKETEKKDGNLREPFRSEDFLKSLGDISIMSSVDARDTLKKIVDQDIR